MLITPRTGQTGEEVLGQLLDLEQPLVRLRNTITQGGPGLAGAYSRWAEEAEELFDRYCRRADVPWLLLYRAHEPMTAAPQEGQLTPFVGRLRRRHAGLRQAIGRVRAEITRSNEAAEELLLLDTDVYLHALHEYVEIDLVVRAGSPSRAGWPVHVMVPIVVLAAGGDGR